MKKIALPIVLVLILVCGYAVVKSMAQETMPKSGGTFDLLGTVVKNLQGEDLGTITDVVTGPEGTVAFVVLRYWVSDDTQKRVAVPFGRLSCKKQNCVLNTNKEAFDSAPVFVFEEDLAEPKLAEEIYRYFGIQPYWTEEGAEK